MDNASLPIYIQVQRRNLCYRGSPADPPVELWQELKTNWLSHLPAYTRLEWGTPFQLGSITFNPLLADGKWVLTVQISYSFPDVKSWRIESDSVQAFQAIAAQTSERNPAKIEVNGTHVTAWIDGKSQSLLELPRLRNHDQPASVFLPDDQYSLVIPNAPQYLLGTVGSVQGKPHINEVPTSEEQQEAEKERIPAFRSAFPAVTDEAPEVGQTVAIAPPPAHSAAWGIDFYATAGAALIFGILCGIGIRNLLHKPRAKQPDQATKSK